MTTRLRQAVLDVPAQLRRLAPDRLELLIVLLVALAVAYQLLLEPIVGMANNADFARLIWPAGIGYKSPADYWETVFKFSETKFVFVAPKPFRYVTSERPILNLARVLNAILSKDGKFDIRSMGLCNAGAYLLAIGAFLRAFRERSAWVRAFVAGAVLLVCTDVRWVAYFNSFYCESASLIFLFSTVGLALLCAGAVRDGRANGYRWLGYLLSAFLFWTAKPQNIAFVPCLAMGAWHFFPDPRRRVLRWMGASLIPICAVLALGFNLYADTTAENVRVVLAEEIIPHSPTPDADRRELGADVGGASLFRVARFYAHHPLRWWSMARRRCDEAFAYIPYGNFSRASGLGAGAQSEAFNTWSEFKKAHYPKKLTLLACLFALYSALAGAKARWLDKGSSARATTLLGPILALGCVLEYVATVTFEANGTAKHLFIFNVAVDLCLLLAATSLMDTIGQIRQQWPRRSVVAQDGPGQSA